MKFKFILYLVVILGLAALAYFLFFHKSDEVKEEKRSGGGGSAKVEAIIVSPQQAADTLTLTGTIDADEKIDVRSEVSGIIEKIYFNEGARVSKGQTLLKINDIELRAQLTSAETRRQLTSE